MSLFDWLLFIHLLSAVILVGAFTALWALVIATRPAAPVLAAEDARRFGRVAGPLVGVGMMGTIIFGIALAIDSSLYHPWDGWIIGALVLWAVAGWSGGEAAKRFDRDPIGGRPAGIRFQALASLAIAVILILMIWKPGA